jgi:hypothetical protein
VATGSKGDVITITQRWCSSSHESVKNRGPVWWEPAIRTGEDFGSLIHTALQAARCVIVVWSYQSIASNWVKDEAQVGWGFCRNFHLRPFEGSCTALVRVMNRDFSKWIVML